MALDKLTQHINQLVQIARMKDRDKEAKRSFPDVCSFWDTTEINSTSKDAQLTIMPAVHQRFL